MPAGMRQFVEQDGDEYVKETAEGMENETRDKGWIMPLVMANVEWENV